MVANGWTYPFRPTSLELQLEVIDIRSGMSSLVTVTVDPGTGVVIFWDVADGVVDDLDDAVKLGHTVW